MFIVISSSFKSSLTCQPLKVIRLIILIQSISLSKCEGRAKYNDVILTENTTRLSCRNFRSICLSIEFEKHTLWKWLILPSMFTECLYIFNSCNIAARARILMYLFLKWFELSMVILAKILCQAYITAIFWRYFENWDWI